MQNQPDSEQASQLILTDLKSEFSNFESQNLSKRMLKKKAGDMSMVEY